MNIVLINTDQQRRDSLGVYGNVNTKTPHIDRLAAVGTIFENAFTTPPICSPARASILTGLYPLHHGILRNPESGCVGGRNFTEAPPFFNRFLAEEGISCHHIGKWHVGTNLSPESCGWSGVDYPGYGYPSAHPHYLRYLKDNGIDGFNLKNERYAEYTDGGRGPLLSAIQEGGIEASVPHYLVSQTLDVIRASYTTERDFFVRCDFWGPHVPYIIPAEYMEMYAPKDIPQYPNFEDSLYRKPTVQRQMREYWGVQNLTWDAWSRLTSASYGYISLIDYEIGRILTLLDELGIGDETAVLFTTDHGGMVGAHGLCDKGPYLYDELCRIPLIASIPGIPGGSRSNAVVYNMDLMPTFLELCGIEPTAGLDARSLYPILRGETEDIREEYAYLEFYGHQVPVLQKLLRTNSYKYIFNGQETDEYYDLLCDPGELTNRIADPAYSAAVRSARISMQTQLTKMGDPVLRYFEGTRLH